VEAQTDFGQMNRKQFIVLLVLVAVLGGAAWVHYRKQAAGWNKHSQELGGKLLGNFQVNNVAQIKIQQDTNDLALAKTNGIWCVEQRDNYPADFGKISQFLLKLRGLKIVQTEEVEPAQLPQLDLAAPGRGTNSATLLQFCDANGKPIRTLWLGRTHMHQGSQASPDAAEESWPDGRYVLAGSNSTTVAVIADPLDEVSPEPGQWLDKTFFSIKEPKSISVDFPEATNSWTLMRKTETNDWELADAKPGEKLDKSKASETANSFSSPSFEDVARDLNAKLTGLDKPTRVDIKTFDGFDYSMKIGHETNDNYYLTVNTSATLPKEPAPPKDTKPEKKKELAKSFQERLKKLQDRLARDATFEKWVYSVPSWTINPLLKTREQLLVPKPAVTKTNTPAMTAPPATKTKS
jgi:Domain of unknown function (DUF4340)